jgi:hypothetical protein
MHGGAETALPPEWLELLHGSGDDARSDLHDGAEATMPGEPLDLLPRQVKERKR